MMKKTEKLSKPWHVGTNLRVLRESYLVNTNMAGFRWFQTSLHPCALEESLALRHCKGYDSSRIPSVRGLP